MLIEVYVFGICVFRWIGRNRPLRASREDRYFQAGMILVDKPRAGALAFRPAQYDALQAAYNPQGGVCTSAPPQRYGAQMLGGASGFFQDSFGAIGSTRFTQQELAQMQHLGMPPEPWKLMQLANTPRRMMPTECVVCGDSLTTVTDTCDFCGRKGVLR